MTVAVHASTAARRRMRTSARLTAYIFILPSVLILLGVFAVPLAETAYYSLTDWRGGLRAPRFIGPDNYVKVWNSSRVREAIGHNFLLLLVIPIEILLAAFVASVLRERIYLWQAYRFLVLVPWMVSITIAGYAWTYFLSPQGIINTLLEMIGLADLTRPWLADPAFALPSVMLLLIWRDTGFATILFYSRLLAVDEAVYEAAALDRANRWQRFINIDLPLLKPTIGLFTVLMSVWIFSFVFNYVFVMTGGGPGTASTVAELEIFREGFAQSRPGYASAISIVLLLITMPIIILQVRLQLRNRQA